MKFDPKNARKMLVNINFLRGSKHLFYNLSHVLEAFRISSHKTRHKYMVEMIQDLDKRYSYE